ARDEELNREVALKEIQPRHADHPESRARFLLEAEITGSLEHPGIVPVYGLGAYGDGRPFYAMRLVKGESLKEALGRCHRGNETPARRRAGAAAAATPRPVCGRLQRRRLRPQPGGAAPRSQAGEHPPGPVRGDAGGGLGPGESTGRG